MKEQSERSVKSARKGKGYCCGTKGAGAGSQSQVHGLEGGGTRNLPRGSNAGAEL